MTAAAGTGTENHATPGMLGLYLFALSAWALRPLAVLGCLLMLWALWRDRRACWPVLRSDSLTWTLLAFAAYALLHALASSLAAPEHWQQQVKDAARIVYLAGLIPVAWYLRADEDRILRCWLLAAAGFLLARLFHLGELRGALGGGIDARIGLGLEPIAFAYYAATILLGILVFAPDRLARLRGRRRIAAALAFALLAVALLQLVILSQSRAAWLALLPLLVVVAAAGLHRARQRGDRATALGTLAVLALLGALLAANHDTLGRRLASEADNWRSLLAGEVAAVSTGAGRGRQHSVGIRVAMVREAVARWREAPLFGHGPAASKLALEESDVFLLPRFNDYHNVPLDLLVRYGALGLLLAVLALALLLAGFRRGWREARLSGATALFLGCALALLLVSCLTNFRLLNWDFRYWLFLVAGPLGSYRYYSRQRSLT